MVMEVAEPAQYEATRLHNAECARGFRVSPMRAACPWACSVLTMLLSLLRDTVKQFINLFVLSYRKIGCQMMLKTQLLGAV